MVKPQVGFKNPYPRRGSRVDAALRRQKLKQTRMKGIKSRQLPKLEAQAEADMAKVRRLLGIFEESV